MEAQNFFYYSLGVGFLILVGFLSYAAYCLANSLKTLTSVLKQAEDISEDLDQLKNGIKFGLINLLQILFKKGGDKDGR